MTDDLVLPFDDRANSQLRRCLRCDATFDSKWIGERICPHCKGSHAWRNGNVLQTHRSRPKAARG
jgi:hypothetical protein